MIQFLWIWRMFSSKGGEKLVAQALACCRELDQWPLGFAVIIDRRTPDAINDGTAAKKRGNDDVVCVQDSSRWFW